MINEELITFIQSQIRKNRSHDEISSRLQKAGWHADDIALGFEKINPPKITPKYTPPQTIVNKAPVAIEIPPEIKTSTSNFDKYREVPEISNSVVVNAPIIPIKPKAPIVSIATDPIKEEVAISPINSYEIPKIEAKPEVKPVKKEEFKPVITPMSDIRHSSFIPKNSPEIKPIPIEKEESIPKLIPKVPPSFIPRPPATSTQPTVDSIVKNIPEGALLTTLSRDIAASSSKQVEVAPKKKQKSRKLLLVFILILLIIGGISFAMISGYIKTPSFSFIKKDPKVLLLGTAATLADLQSYKSETHIIVSLPSFANITNGLTSGDPVASNNKDTFSLNIKGLNQNYKNSPLPSLSSYSLNIKSSLLKNDINSNIKYDGSTMYIEAPDMKGLLGEKALPTGIVSVDSNQTELLLTFLPKNWADQVRKADTYNILSDGVPNILINNMGSSLETFINSVNVIEKDPENIKGQAMYHYQITADRTETKKLLNSFADPVISSFSDSNKQGVSEALGSTTLNSFDVWVGKNDSLIHQYKFSINIPLSKVISLDDSGIAGNIVTLDWQTTLYDFDVINDITIPKKVTPLPDFINLISDQKLKDTLASFKDASLILRNAIGSYGKHANLGGSCTEPSSGSLFSPVGHTKGAANSVGTIAGIMNEILDITGDKGQCFSTLNTWAVAVPLASSPTSTYCIDNTGVSMILTEPLTNTICK